MAKPFFSTKAKGLNADLERHNKAAIVLQNDIDRLTETKDRCPLQEACLELYKSMMERLMASKADVVAEIGKNK